MNLSDALDNEAMKRDMDQEEVIPAGEVPYGCPTCTFRTMNKDRAIYHWTVIHPYEGQIQ